MTSGDVARPPVAVATATRNQQTTMTQHYGARGSQRQSLPSGWMELTDAASNRPYYFHAINSRMVFSKAEMLLKSPPVTPSPTPNRTSSPATRTSSPATDRSLAPEPDHAVSARIRPTIMEATHGTREEPIEFSSCSSSSSVSSSSELTISQTQTFRPTSIRSDGNESDSEATSY
jgi:hypothetical protein